MNESKKILLDNIQYASFSLKVVLILFLFFSKNLLLLGEQDPLTKADVLEKMRLANNYFMKKWPDPSIDIITDKRRPSNIWTRAVYYEGLIALFRIDPNEIYYNYAVQWAESHNWEPAYGGTTTRNADNQACGQTYIELYQIDLQPKRIEKIKTVIDRMVNSDKIDDWWWIDALHMAMPVFAKLGTIYKDTSYFHKMYEMYMFTKTKQGGFGLYNPIDHLWWRDKDFTPPHTSPNGEDTYWSRGNGWVFAALTRVLDVLPEDAPHRDEYIKTFKEMAEALISVQRDDGFWNVSLHDPNEYGGKETSGTALFTYGLAWGANKGILTDSVYKKAAIKAWNGMVKYALHENGFLGYVQSTGKQPSDGQPVTYDKAPNFEDYGLGAFLLAGSEIYKLADATSDFSSENLRDNLTIPNIAILHPPFPNPFNPQITISYSLYRNGNVLLSVFDLIGQELKTLVNQYQNRGDYNILFYAANLASGTYILRLKVDELTQYRKVILLR
ncbi:MAG: glycoside hydrolase family 88 protein [Melioribacteraceae bacterium]